MTSAASGTAGETDAAYARAVGERLRHVRRHLGLSLQAVEQRSAHEFKASVLGAYERGERVISVPRLHRLAMLYGVAVDSLLPMPTTVGRDRESQDGHGRAGAAELEARLATIAERDPEILDRYVRMIRSRRNRPEGVSIAIREEDVRAMELLLPAAPPPPGGG